MDKVTWWHFQSNCVPKFFDYMHGLKSAIWAIFQKGLGWPCPVSVAHKNASLYLKSLERLEDKISAYSFMLKYSEITV